MNIIWLEGYWNMIHVAVTYYFVGNIQIKVIYIEHTLPFFGNFTHFIPNTHSSSPNPRKQLTVELLRLYSGNETELWNSSSYNILSFVLLFQWKTAFQNQMLIKLIQSILLKSFKSLSYLDTVRNRQCTCTN